jgi:hypothetical protein
MTEIVLRVVRGESIEEVAREIQVPVLGEDRASVSAVADVLSKYPQSFVARSEIEVESALAALVRHLRLPATSGRPLARMVSGGASQGEQTVGMVESWKRVSVVPSLASARSGRRYAPPLEKYYTERPHPELGYLTPRELVLRAPARARR